MTLCIECNGNGKKAENSFILNVNGTTIAQTEGPQVFPTPATYKCTGCAGTGIYQNFGA